MLEVGEALGDLSQSPWRLLVRACYIFCACLPTALTDMILGSASPQADSEEGVGKAVEEINTQCGAANSQIR